MPFGVVTRVGRGMGVIDGVEIVEGTSRKGAALGVNLGRPIINNGDFALLRGCRRGSSQMTLGKLVFFLSRSHVFDVFFSF